MEDGTVTEIDIDARATAIISRSIIDGGRVEFSRLTVRVTNLGDNNNGDANDDGVPDNQLEFVFRAILSIGFRDGCYNHEFPRRPFS